MSGPEQVIGNQVDLEAAVLEAEWQTLAEVPVVREYLRTQDDLVVFLREVAALFSQEIGMDWDMEDRVMVLCQVPCDSGPD